ncbi:hypothetical protein Scep_010725 [Stephania cephalantha]|uniref:BHLH domain-containing protein n=1 Tax=Stephania cephalantha TaxID=152367 RepID=A0AAP0JWC8_9MAGN
MENEKFFHHSGSSPNPLIDMQLVGELNCGSSDQQLPNCFLNLNWENSLNQQQQQQQQQQQSSIAFESALSSLVSSPAASNTAAAPGDSAVIRELIGKLGSICNSGEISPQSHTLRGSYLLGGSANDSCYSTPLSSPPKLNLSMMDHHVRVNSTTVPPHHPHHHHHHHHSPSLAPFPADPGFAERAARYSCFGNASHGNYENELAYRTENGKLSRASSNQSLKTAVVGSQMANNNNNIQEALQEGVVEMEMRKFSRLSSRPSTPDNAREESSASEVIPGGEPASRGPANDGNARKRKAPSKGKGANDAKVSLDEDSNAKRSKANNDSSAGNEKGGAVKAKEETNNNNNNDKGGDGAQKQSKENAKPPEPPKDYIHVRARRGQATDSHSLAERVRREKISERMKFLQDLVPGCNKVTGKAVMLDEIINYVQSLQRQVEFLSMKLATVNPRLDFNMDSLLSKDILHSRGPFAHNYPLDSTASAFLYGQQPQQQGLPLQSGISDGADTQCSVNPLEAIALRRNLSMQLPPLDGFGDAASQIAAFWEDDLQSVVQMGFGQNQQPQGFHGSLPTTNMKVEL